MSRNCELDTSVMGELSYEIDTADMPASICGEAVTAMNTALEKVQPGTKAAYNRAASKITLKFPAGTNVSELTFEEWENTVDDRWGRSVNEAMRGRVNDPVVAIRLDSETGEVASFAIVPDTTAGTDDVLIVENTEGWLNREGTRAGFNSLADCSGSTVFTGPGEVEREGDDGGYFNVCTYVPDEEQSTDTTDGGAWGQSFFSRTT